MASTAEEEEGVQVTPYKDAHVGYVYKTVLLEVSIGFLQHESIAVDVTIAIENHEAAGSTRSHRTITAVRSEVAPKGSAEESALW